MFHPRRRSMVVEPCSDWRCFNNATKTLLHLATFNPGSPRLHQSPDLFAVDSGAPQSLPTCCEPWNAFKGHSMRHSCCHILACLCRRITSQPATKYPPTLGHLQHT